MRRRWQVPHLRPRRPPPRKTQTPACHWWASNKQRRPVLISAPPATLTCQNHCCRVPAGGPAAGRGCGPAHHPHGYTAPTPGHLTKPPHRIGCAGQSCHPAQAAWRRRHLSCASRRPVNHSSRWPGRIRCTTNQSAEAAWRPELPAGRCQSRCVRLSKPGN